MSNQKTKHTIKELSDFLNAEYDKAMIKWEDLVNREDLTKDGKEEFVYLSGFNYALSRIANQFDIALEWEDNLEEDMCVH